MDAQQIAEAFSRHRFREVYDRFAPDLRWRVPGQDTLEGKDAVIAACESSLAGLEQLERTEFSRFVSVAGPSTAAVDAIGHYIAADGARSVVSSADIYEFDADGMVTTITSYAVELSD